MPLASMPLASSSTASPRSRHIGKGALYFETRDYNRASSASRPNIRPALFLQFQDTHDPGLYYLRLGNEGIVLGLDLVPGIAASFKGDFRRTQRNHFDLRLHRRGVVT